MTCNWVISPASRRTNTYQVKIPDDQINARVPELISGRTMKLDKGVNLPPQSTVVLYLPN